MSDDRLSELLEVADGPVSFPADRRAELRAEMLATAAQPRRDDLDGSLPLHSADRPPKPSSRGWRPVATVAAGIALVVAAIVASSRLSDRSPEPVVTTPIDRPATAAELCERAREDAAANGLIGSGVPSSAIELRRLTDALEDLAVGSDGLEPDLVALAARVRLMAAAVDEADGATVINTRQAIGRDVEALFDPGGVCGG